MPRRSDHHALSGLTFFPGQTCGLAFCPMLQYAAGACCSDLGAQHYGLADEIEFLENYKTHVASAVIMMQVQPPTGESHCCMLSASNQYGVMSTLTAVMLPFGWYNANSQRRHITYWRC